ncbi:hypothetical protein [Bdellovibrio sp. BCCA]|uniref:hypothetical protein n=1 Tax=Bdellovibrio sp. BCCA TaxID=3136281 RepID=UPI0030EFAFD5
MLYAGIGSRNISKRAEEAIEALSRFLSYEGFVVRSGGARGSDSAFESGSRGEADIYRPEGATEESIDYAGRFADNFSHFKEYTKRLFGRNAQIILGADLKSRVDFVICYTETPDAGGTSHGIRIAKANGIKVYNLFNFEDFVSLESDLGLNFIDLYPKFDGVNHINVYSKGSTELGRFLSNFERTEINLPEGRFQSLEGYWYYLNCPDSEGREVLRGLYGYDAKRIGRELRATDWNNDASFKAKIKSAMYVKVCSNPLFYKKLCECKLPLKHYYLTENDKIDVPECDWIMEAWAVIRSHGLKRLR